MSVIHNYVDTDFFRPTDGSSFEQNTPYVLSQGLAKRDYRTLIRAMWQLPHVECYISAVSAWDKFKADYEGLEMPDNVILRPFDHPSVIREAFSRCRFAVIPLRTDIGMWCAGSTSVLQAQAMCRPIIVTYLPGIAEYVKDEETGYLVEGNDPIALAEKIDYLWKNPELVENMGRRAHSWVMENFTLEKWIDSIVNLLDQLR
jgi:glycosyltransferase involved in cell wall biosynthesis